MRILTTMRALELNKKEKSNNGRIWILAASRKNWINYACAILLVPAFIGCTPNQRIIESAQTPAPVSSSPAVASLETDLQAMRNADFKFIVVFRRKDNAVMDSEDKSFVNANVPYDANRRKLSDDGRAIIIGSNFPFFPGTIVNLTDRFLMEDHSKPDSGPIEVDRNAKPTASPAATK